ncbi:MAG: dihydrodipicolinate synthase family protein [Candidatus Promineifilaceae bacterium]
MQAFVEKLHHKIIPAMATPIDISGNRVSLKDVPPLVDFLIERHVGGLFVGGTTGEGVLLSVEQRKLLHKAVVEAAAGRVPVLLHVGTNTTRDTFDLAVHSESIGADANVAVTPYFYGIDDQAMLHYYQEIAKAAPNLPLLAYDIPHFANNGVTPSLLTELFETIPQFAGVKCSRKDAQMIRRLIDVTPADKMMLVGSEQIMLGSLAMGATGAISGLSTAIPEPFVKMITAYSEGRMKAAQQWFRLSNQVLAALASEPRLGGIKAVLNQRGAFVGDPIAPRPKGSDQAWKKALDVIERFGGE